MKFIKKIFKTFKKIILNKYILVFLLFMVYFVFFDKHNLISRWQIYQKNKQLEKELNYYKKKIEEDKLKLYELKSSDENLEKFARERYYFKKDKEDIFVLP